MNNRIEGILCSIFSSRIILNIREAAYPEACSSEIQLHTQQQLSTLIDQNCGYADDAWVHEN